MRELRIIADLSTAKEIIVEFVAPDDRAGGAATTGNRMRLPVTDQLTALLADDKAEADEATQAAEASANDDQNSAAPTNPEKPEAQAVPAQAELQSAEPVKPAVVLRPREIQDRVRAGASVTQLAEETGMAERKIEPFAHPVLLERSRIAELGKDARPVRSDGPAQLTLLEVLDTAFAARGNDIEDAAWDAWRDRTGQWIVAVSFEVGLSSSTAEWSFHPGGGSAATAVARNSIAADLIDPDFANPVRSLSAVGPIGAPASNQVAGQAAMPTPPSGQGQKIVQEDRDTANADAVADRSGPQQLTAGSRNEQTLPIDQGAPHDVDDAEADSFLQHPDEEQPRRRRRKTVLPSWDDVLLDVRPTGKK